MARRAPVAPASLLRGLLDCQEGAVASQATRVASAATSSDGGRQSSQGSLRAAGLSARISRQLASPSLSSTSSLRRSDGLDDAFGLRFASWCDRDQDKGVLAIHATDSVTFNAPAAEVADTIYASGAVAPFQCRHWARVGKAATLVVGAAAATAVLERQGVRHAARPARRAAPRV